MRDSGCVGILRDGAEPVTPEIGVLAWVVINEDDRSKMTDPR
jgi:hypothetical protein